MAVLHKHIFVCGSVCGHTVFQDKPHKDDYRLRYGRLHIVLLKNYLRCAHEGKRKKCCFSAVANKFSPPILSCSRTPENVHGLSQKIQGTYFKISALYFKIYGLYFLPFQIAEKQCFEKPQKSAFPKRCLGYSFSDCCLHNSRISS